MALARILDGLFSRSPELESGPAFPEPPRKDLPTVGNCVGVIPQPHEFALATNGT